MDLVGLGVANLGAGLSGTFVVNGSPTKTQMVDGAGGRSQLAQLVTVGIVLMVLLFFTAPLAYLPEAVLSAVVFLIGVELVDVKGMRKIYVERPWEFWVALITTVVVVFWGVEQGIILAIALSLLVHTRHGYRPKNIVLVTTDERALARAAGAQRGAACAGVAGLPVHPQHVLCKCRNALAAGAGAGRGGASAIVLVLPGCRLGRRCGFLGGRGSALQLQLSEGQGIRPVFAAVSDDVRAELDRSGITELVGENAYYATVDEVVTAYRQKNRQP